MARMRSAGTLISILILFCQCAFAQSFLLEEAKYFGHDIRDLYSIGIEAEFYGVSDDKVIDIITSAFSTGYIRGDIRKGIYINTHLGDIRFYVEGQAWRYAGRDEQKYQQQIKEDLLNAPREIAFPPLRYSDLIFIHMILSQLEASGAVGTDETSAVSLQVNVQMPRLTSYAAAQRLLNLLRVYYKPSHASEAEKIINVPQVRKQYVGNYSPGFMRKLFNPYYYPSPRELFDDFMYRQSSEVLGYQDAWTAPIEAIQSRLLKLDRDAVVPAVIKMNKIRISSLLMDAFPDDPLSLLAVKYEWAKPVPIVEFREFNNDFKVYDKVEMALGVIEASRVYGNYDHHKVFKPNTNLRNLSSSCEKALLH